LEDVERLDEVTGVGRKKYNGLLSALSDEEYWEETKRVDGEVRRIWMEIEGDFMRDVRPKHR
jgi:hypothetical protein